MLFFFSLWRGKHIAMPLDALPVYTVEKETKTVQGGSGQDLAKQISCVLKKNLEFQGDKMHYIGVFFCNFHVHLNAGFLW